jgi:pimeloyl-ACP methyl ester carboxylesterase
MSIEALRTPDPRFVDLDGWPYQPRYVTDLEGYEGLRMHYVDEGPADAEHVFLCLHGEPTWAYLYRKMIPVFVEAGHRVIAPDFFGFGRSDKPVDDAVYTFGFHRGALMRFVEKLDPKNVTLVCQDWGGILGLTLPMDMPGRFSRLLVMNTAIVAGDLPASKGFLEWRDYVAKTPDLDVARLMKRACEGLTDAEAHAYAAPFPDDRYKAGVRTFPAIVPIEKDMEGADVGRRAGAFWSGEWDGPIFMAVGEKDPVLGPPVMAMMRMILKGCPEPLMLPNAGHFVQEHGDVVARAALEAWG